MAKKEKLDSIDEYKDILNKQHKLLDVIPKIQYNSDLQQTLLDKYLPAPHTPLKILTWIIDIVYGGIIIFLSSHLIYSFVRNNWMYISGDFFMIITIGIIMSIIKTHNYTKQYPIFIVIILLCLLFFVMNCIGFQQAITHQLNQLNIADILKVLQH